MHQGDYSMTADFPKPWINTVTTAYLLILIVMEKMQQKMRIRKDATKAAKPQVITSQSIKAGGAHFWFLFIGEVWYCSEKIESAVSKV